MISASLDMSASAKSSGATATSQLDAILGKLRDKARPFARLGPAERAALVEACIPRLVECADAWVAAAVAAKGLRPEHPEVSEEILGGPMTTVRNLRWLAWSLREIARTGKPTLGQKRFGQARDGVTTVEVFPGDALDGALFSGFRAEVRMQPELTPSQVVERQAAFYGKKAPEGGVSLVLGAGNVASIPPMDALYKMFVEGHVCLVKLNPVNEYLQPFYERALAPLVEAGYLAFVRGGGDVGSYLVSHALVDDVHITGSDRTHDLIVWGPPGAERERRIAAGTPLLQKTITSELGCVTPVVIAPAVFTESELGFLAEHVATMVINNASCNCNAGKMLVTSKGWAQRDAFFAKLRTILGEVPSRKAYYPGAFDRYEHLVGGRPGVETFGERSAERLPWTVVPGLDPASNDRLFTTEPFCPIVSEAVLPETDPLRFIEAATLFCNDKLWGTLSAVMVIHPSIQRDPQGAAAVERAAAELRYGAVAINCWTGVVYGLVTPPWGAHPSSTLANIQGGLGWVHNTFMLDGIEKVVLRTPLTITPKPPYFATHKNAHEVARRVLGLEAAPSWWKVPGIALKAFFG
jgi:acyl-CoA reductase-like NAD-dependent aldehyde dehydrogenase